MSLAAFLFVAVLIYLASRRQDSTPPASSDDFDPDDMSAHERRRPK